MGCTATLHARVRGIHRHPTWHPWTARRTRTPISSTTSFYEVNKYYSVTHHIFTAEPVVMSLDKFNSFTPERQQMLLSCAYEARQDPAREVL
jgi:TRAP-type C4-dicarboxylate transport system substrate-binding protein